MPVRTHRVPRLHPAGLVIWLALLALTLIVPVARAQDQDQSVTVERRDGEITILQNGDVQVRETWVTRFDGGPFRFAFRAIPLNRVEEITDWGVSENGATYKQASSQSPQTFRLERDDNGGQKITWYFPPTSDATRTFNLSYTLRGALRIYPDGDQFFWKFIEADRAYTINASRILLRLPTAVDPSRLKATTYANGAEDQQAARIVDNQTIEFTGSSFSGGDEWEVRAQFPPGIVSADPPSWQAADDAEREAEAARLARQPFYNLLSLGTALVVLIGGGLGVYLLWYTRGRDTPSGLVAPYYATPPENVPPGIVGTLLDEKVDMQDILATLVDLARRGYMQIVEGAPTASFTKTPGDFTFVRGNADVSQLRPFERRLYDKIFGSTIQERTLSSLKNKFYSEIGDIQRAMYDEAVQLGYFDRNPNTTRNSYTALGCLTLGATIGLGFLATVFLLAYAPLFMLVVIAFGIVAITLLILSRFMSRKTEAGSTAAAKWRGFKRYLQNISQYEQVEAASNKLDQFLPYAIAFGIEQDVVRQFERVNAPAPTWYYPYGYPVYAGYGGGILHDRSSGSAGDRGGSSGGGMPSLDSAAGRGFGGLNAMSAGLFTMLNTTSSTLTSQPQSSGSSGGFSGGGGGGGGGSSGFG